MEHLFHPRGAVRGSLPALGPYHCCTNVRRREGAAGMDADVNDGLALWLPIWNW